VDRPGIFGEEPSSSAVTYESEVIHPAVSVNHRAIDRTEISSVQSEICPERSTEKSRSANHKVMSIKYIDPRISACPKQISAQILHGFSIELVIAGNIHDRTPRKMPTRPFDALNPDVNVARKNDNVRVYLRGAQC
jgi:hypothetical protein